MVPELLISSFGLAFLGALIVARIAHKVCLMDCPNERSSHSHPTPKGGGVGILAVFLVAGVLCGASVWFGATVGLMTLIAGYGDRVDLPVRLRLILQLVLIAALVLGTVQSSASSYLSLPLVLFWIVFIAGTANFYNFMDGIDGIAGITGVVGFSFLSFYINRWEMQSGLGVLSLCMAFSCLGFLPFNMPKARVFMGDIGSILLGATFASLVFLTSHTLLDFLCMASFLFPFYADELSTMALRIKDGEKLTNAHRRHLYQLLANEWVIPHWRISAAYGILQALVGLSVLKARSYGVASVSAVLVCWSGLFMAGEHYVRIRLEREERRINASPP